MESTVEFTNFELLDIRVGTVVELSEFPEARNPAYKIKVDFGEIGIKQSSAQITNLYHPDDLLNTQVIAVINFPPKHIAGFKSEILILGIYTDDGVILLRPDHNVMNGSKVG